MIQNHFNSLINSPLIGFAHHQILLDVNHCPVDYKFLEANVAFSNMTGISPDKIINKNVTDVFPGFREKDNEWIMKYGKIALEGGNLQFDSYSEVLKRWYRVYAYSPEKYFFSTFFLDITDEKTSNEELKILSYAVKQSSISVVITDLAGNIQYVNPKFSELTGYTLEEVKNKNPKILKSGYQDKNFYKNFWDTISSGNAWQGEFHNKKKNGELFWEWASVSPIINEKGITTHYVAVKEDITQRKETEEQLLVFSNVVEQSPNMILIADLDGNALYANKSYYTITGYKPENVIGHKFKLLDKTDAFNRHNYSHIIDTVTKGETWHGELFDGKSNGDLYWLSLSVNPVFNEKKKILYYVADMQDISDRKKVEDEVYDLNINLENKVNERTIELTFTNEVLMKEVLIRKNNEEELKQARIEADKANKAKSDFISKMSHELRTPLNSILGFAQLFSMGELTPSQTKGVNHILNSGKHLLKLINEILDISKIEAGRYNIQIDNIQLGEIINDACDLIIPLASTSNIKIEYQKSKNDLLFVKGDKQALIQIMINLLNNAVKYNKVNGSVKIKTDLIHDDLHSRSFLRVSVTDTGVGIEDKNLEKLFSPFERFGQGEYSTEGTGLGLNIAKELITLMDGRINVYSTFGKGSTFFIDIPCAEFDNSEHIKTQLNASLDFQNIEVNKEGVILYIEDNMSNVELMDQILSENRPNIQMITDVYGGNAVKLALKHKPFLIILDLNLPDMHGSEVIKHLKDNTYTREIPVIILSADAMPTRQRSLMDMGAEYYLTKPIHLNDLLLEIDKYQH